MALVAHRITHFEDPATFFRKTVYQRDLELEYDTATGVHATRLELTVSGNYLSAVYRVDFTWEASTATTYVRIDIPLWTSLYRATAIGVVLIVEGGLDNNTGVNPDDETGDDWYETRNRLASGTRFAEDAGADINQRPAM